MGTAWMHVRGLVPLLLLHIISRRLLAAQKGILPSVISVSKVPLRGDRTGYAVYKVTNEKSDKDKIGWFMDVF